MKKRISIIAALCAAALLLFAGLPFFSSADEDEFEMPEVPFPGGQELPVKGDADGDGDVTSTDARLTLQLAVEAIDPEDVQDPVLLDVDADKEISSTDARLILQKAVGKIKNWP